VIIVYYNIITGGGVLPRKHFTCGIYGIITPNNSIYIGSSIKIEQRFSEHKSMLKYGRHHSIRLQRAFNKHGKNLKFKIIHRCIPEDLNKKEQEYIDKFGAKLNTTKFINNVWLNPETRLKIEAYYKTDKFKKERSKIAKNISTRWREVECSNGEKYKNLTDAARAFGIRASGMSHLVRTHQIGRLGVKFKYSNEEWKPETTLSERLVKTRIKNGTLKHSEKSKKRMRKARAGCKPTLKAIRNAAKTNSIPIIGVSIKNGKIVKYSSTRKAAENHHKKSIRTAQAQICKCIYGVKNIAYGYKWAKSKANPKNSGDQNAVAG